MKSTEEVAGRRESLPGGGRICLCNRGGEVVDDSSWKLTVPPMLRTVFDRPLRLLRRGESRRRSGDTSSGVIGIRYVVLETIFRQEGYGVEIETNNG